MKHNFIIGAIMVCASATAIAQTNYTYHYWFDSSPDVTTVSAGENLTIDADVSGLTQGLHLLHCFSVDAGGVQSSTSSEWFLKTFQPLAESNGKVVLHLDGKQFSVVDGNVSPEGLINVEADLNGADCGIHTMGATFVTAEGVSTQYEERFFYRFPTTVDMQTFDGYYILDASVMGSVKGGHAGAVTLDIDAAELTTGFHNLSIFMATPKGYSTNVVNSIFYKIPAGGEGLRSYRYWVNDDMSDASSTQLSKVENPLSLVKMFDIPSRPFRSRDFALDTSEGGLKLYARNTLNFQTLDTENKISFASTDYTDSRVSKPLEESEITPLPEGVGSVKAVRPADNGIRWYSFQGEPGGLLKISTDRGCITDVFAPDGERIDRAEGSDALKERNVQLLQTGTYFVAVHDFERSVNNLALSYVNLNKYAVVSTTPNETCPDGLLMMSVYGNGMNHLKSARLEKEGCIIEATKIQANDNYTATLQFNLEKEQLGTYSLFLQFKNDEDASIEHIQIRDVLSVVPKQEGDVTVSVIPSNRGGSDVYDITLRIQNTGNVPYWGIPVNIASQLDGGEYALLYKGFFTESVSETLEYVNSSTTTDNLLNSGKTGSFEPFLLPYIGPHQTIDLTLGLVATAHTRVNIYAWCGKPWSLEAEEMLAPDYDIDEVIYWPQTNIVSLKTLMCAKLWIEANRGASKAGMPAKAPSNCNPPSWFDLVDFDFPHVPDASDLAERTGDIAQAIGMTIAGIYLGTDMVHADALAQSLGYQGADDPNYIRDFPDVAELNNRKRQAMPHPNHIIATALGFGDEYEMMARYQQGCPNSPTPHATPTQVEMLGACDPNDMYGYIAPGGGNYVGLDVKTLEYTIEFENDPELANASALTVKVHDKLDGNVFDLATFATREVTIGNRKISVPDSHQWVRTIDMRPEINGVAQVSFSYDAATGDANWELVSLDPMSMEVTDVINQGFLPVNNDNGDGTGFLSYTVNLKENLADNTEISNKATIIFDANEPIETPSYLNVTDYQRPTSWIVNTDTDDSRTFTFTVDGEDDGSGIWYYNLYVRSVDDADWKLAGSNYEENIFTYSAPDVVGNTQFMVIAYDRAGNVQDGTLVDVKLGDADGNGVVNANDAVVIRNYYVGRTDVINTLGADASCDGKINAQDALAVRTIYLGKTKIKQLNKLRKRKYAN